MGNDKKLKKSQNKRKDLQRQLDDSSQEIARLRAQLAAYEKEDEERQNRVAGPDEDKVEAHFREAITPPETIEEVQALEVLEPEVVAPAKPATPRRRRTTKPAAESSAS